ncbi:Uma2 family endonuclease [soil metagenome]
MTAAVAPYRWSLDEFVRAWEAGVFSERAELIDGEVWPVPIGNWHGDTAARVLRALPNDDYRVTTASLPTADSLPDPDCWVRRASARGVRRLSERLWSWEPTDVVLVVEVADETLEHDLGVKAELYAGAGYPCYWVIAHEGVYEHREPSDAGFRSRLLHRPGEEVVDYSGGRIAVDDLLAPA